MGAEEIAHIHGEHTCCHTYDAKVKGVHFTSTLSMLWSLHEDVDSMAAICAN